MLHLIIPRICECAEYGNGGSSSNGDICYSLIMNDIYGIQVNYNLEKDDKWTIVYNMLLSRESLL